VPALPLLLVGLIGTGQAAQNRQDWMRAPDVVAYALVAVAALALLLRRRAPTVTLVVCGLAVSTYLALGYPFGPILLTGPAAAYAVATRLAWRPAVTWCSGFLVVTAAAAGPHFIEQPSAGWLGYLVWTATWFAIVAAPGVTGAALQVRRRSEAGVRVEQARRAVSEERLAMAQDVHDGVGHGLAVIAMHAGVALHVLDRNPERVRELLMSIQATSRESLDGLRANLDRLRSTGAVSVTVRPAPGLGDLPVLLDRMRDGGLVIHDEIDGAATLPPAIDAAAYRIVQESLTNVLRHAGGDTAAWVRIARHDDTLLVEVRDRGGAKADPRAPAGTGIIGMRQRAGEVNGSLHAGRGPEGGYVVRAELPLPVAAALDAVTP